MIALRDIAPVDVGFVQPKASFVRSKGSESDLKPEPTATWILASGICFSDPTKRTIEQLAAAPPMSVVRRIVDDAIHCIAENLRSDVGIDATFDAAFPLLAAVQKYGVPWHAFAILLSKQHMTVVTKHPNGSTSYGEWVLGDNVLAQLFDDAAARHSSVSSNG